MPMEDGWIWAETDMAWKLGVANTADRAQLVRLVDEAFDRILTPEVGPGRVFVLKPNLGFCTDEKGGTTSPALLAAVLNKIQRDYAPSRVCVVESDGIGLPNLCWIINRAQCVGRTIVSCNAYYSRSLIVVVSPSPLGGNALCNDVFPSRATHSGAGLGTDGSGCCVQYPGSGKELYLG